MKSICTKYLKLRRTGWSDTLLLLVSLSVVYFLFLGVRALAIPDEQRYAEIGREMLASGHYMIPHIDGIQYFEKPDLFYWLQGLSIKLFGVNEWAARFWVATFGILGSIVTYWMTSRLFDRLVSRMDFSDFIALFLYGACFNFRYAG